MTKNIFRTSLAVAITLGMGSCSLKEELGSTLTKQQADSVITVPSLLKNAYDGLQMPYQDFSNTWGMMVHSTDEAVGPTRAGDWDDNGVWRALHEHTWNADHAHIQSAFSSLLQLQFSATNVLNFRPSDSQAAEARFLRALSMFTTVDLWGQVPFRTPEESLLQAPKVLKAAEAVDFIIAELKEILPNLPDRPTTAAYVANKDAARFLLMKCYLNKGTFINREAPTFDAGDMQQVITYADQIINGTGGYKIADNYFDNFARDNDVKSTENIFTQRNGAGFSTIRAGNSAFARWKFTLHYNMNPSGWNGFATLSDFYDKFESTDTRRGGSYTGVTDISGLRVGFLVGQQYDQNGVAIKDRKGNPLAFTREVAIKETGANLEVTGIRVIKYPPDFLSSASSKDGQEASNDYVFFRYADVLLMKAEALLRTGSNAGLTIVNEIRTKRGATAFGSLTLANLLDERGRELYWEGWRRQDLIRFGKYLEPWQLKTTDNKRNLLFPIPTSDLAVNKNLTQNPGY
ncbi:RagB/SusD family nutrient uptake outer membrane protein [Chitinophaga sp. sic0106]|uniref:RagB/SusD family nutrient uptake outer membrane protein n=1 Tax=Chitinophaga sp. sic0106 TaxID=2854785 RepID=UPI001C44048F|nr:RagB/SusD family nutrient uptake outer membrane protein [Chitinophaga sp. sic0106]MBV7528590.1 RagB/SusD family nutrient uptake outer membrane protein [Chitinophaga sp. sic0106]